ncbi:AmmeMemoRadiSam system protein B [Patescibacteria group bacterium]|nr:AmmeMemoRadiSam system protein B [Patescibacteria group bacterium]
MTDSIRLPIAAGSYYPADPEQLMLQIEDCLDKVNETEILPVLPRILIVPHAGLSFSGSTAAYGFKQIQNTPINRVILLGSSHQVPFGGVSVSPQDIWRTPLGDILVDDELTQNLLNSLSIPVADQQAHEQEHSLEVQLPFLQMVLNDFKIVPLLVGSENRKQTENLALALAGELDEKTVLIVSSDLSHYPDYETANDVDARFIEAILSRDISKLEETNYQLLGAGHANLLCCACAMGAVKTAVLTANKIGADKTQLLHYTNSGDKGGDWDRVVGYAAMKFS